MGTLAQKVQYLADTKSAIKQAVVNKGVAVENSDAFRSYASKISQIDTLHTQQKTVTPTTSQQTITPDTGYNALSNVTVNAVTANIDSNITADNIKQGVSILGVEGNMLNINWMIERNTQSVVIPYGVTKIGSYALAGFPNLISVVIPSTVTRIDTYGFMYSRMPAITIPASVVSFGVSVFSGCRQLSSINLLTTHLGDQMFYLCTALTGVSIPSGTTEIPSSCFGQCESMATLSLPNTITNIAVSTNPFVGCIRLENVTLENGFNSNNLNLSASTKYSAETLEAMLDALADRTGQAAYTLTLGAVNLAKLTTDQIAVATAKNWNLA